METVLGIFCKHPVPGRVKTRIAVQIGQDPAARLYEAFLSDIVARMRQTLDQRILCYAPDTPQAAAWFDKLSSGDYRLVPQSQGDLGARLAALFAAELRGGPRKVIVIGSDSPTISTDVINRACDQLDRRDAVIGPSNDGGYYLLGLRRMVSGLFDGIDWSTCAVYDQQSRRLREAGLTVGPLAPLGDVDTIDDLRQVWEDPLLQDSPATHRVLRELKLP